MRTKIDYGIDLGTTNSAIARIENGKPVIKKSDTLKDTLPSAININKKKDVLIGDQAFNLLKNDRIKALKTFQTESVNTFIEFKRTMGTNTPYTSSNMGRDFSSEQLSAEVLMKLKSLVPDENIKSIVITVPAKFTMVHKDATMRAGKLAGFEHVELLQEPIAASMAYGLDSSQKDGLWLVFDFGGGTFDAALIKVEEGIMKVLDTEGDNYLGGKNLDEAIVDQIIIPYLSDNYSISDILRDSNKKEILRDAMKSYAEECKIQLSFRDTHNILTDLGDLPFEDEEGEEPSLDIEVSQTGLEKVVGPIFQKAIDISKELLQRNNLKAAQLATLLLVGGPTYSPILRKMLKEQMLDKVNTSIDPMTSVATGAALYASTISISKDIVDQSRDRTKIQIEIQNEATTVETEEMVNIKVLREKTDGQLPEKIFADIVRGDKAWASGKKMISEKPILVDVQLNTGTSNYFEVSLYDDRGDKLDCQPNSFTILQGINPADATLPYHVGIEVWDERKKAPVFLPLKGLAKNAVAKSAVGVSGTLKLPNQIRPGMASDKLVIPIYQGENEAKGTRAFYNNHVVDVTITGESIPAVLPAGSDVEITFKLDRSERATCSVFFPLLNHTEEIPVVYKEGETVDITWLKRELQNARRSSKAILDEAANPEVEKAAQNIAALSAQLENEQGNEDGKIKILTNLRKEMLVVDKHESAVQWPKIKQQLKDDFYELEELIEKITSNGDDEKLMMDKVTTQLEEFRKNVDAVIQSEDVELGKGLVDSIDAFRSQVVDAVAGLQRDIQLLEFLDESFSTFTWTNQSRARQLITEGLEIANGNPTEQRLRKQLQQIIQLMDRNDPNQPPIPVL